jgi:general secretion pathway protein G
MKTHVKTPVNIDPSNHGSKAIASACMRYRRPSCNAGFSLLELVIVTAIIAVLAALVVPAYNHFVEGVKVTRCRAEIRGLEQVISSYALDKYVLPDSLNDVGRGSLLDPWGNAYQYVNIEKGGIPRKGLFGGNLNSDFDLYSVGKDGLSDASASIWDSPDDVARAGNGAWVGLASTY